MWLKRDPDVKKPIFLKKFMVLQAILIILLKVHINFSSEFSIWKILKNWPKAQDWVCYIK